MGMIIDYNREGELLKELEGIVDAEERKSRLLEVIEGIEGILVPQYADGLKDVKKLEHRLTQRTSFTREALEIFSRGVQEPLKRGLDDLKGYNRDTVNGVFIALYEHLVNEIKTRQLDYIVDHNRDDDTNAELAELMDQINIYHAYSTWVNQNERSIEGLDQQEMEKASKQFRDLKKSAVGFMSAFRSLLWQDNNIVSIYALFDGSKTLENYDASVEVLDGTITDCAMIVSSSSNIRGNGWSAVIKLASTIRLNAEYYFLKMGYDVYHDNNMRANLQDPEQFKQDLMSRARSMRYLHVTNIIGGPSALQLSTKERTFYEVELNPKPSK
ncbi:MAG: hypothetical protein IIC69_00510 [Nanoarchaeota archaeon]|nr:hypothetical protein [Nanoarchaeota archaeon]